MSTIHWIGAGLSAVPGIRRLIANQHRLVLWNRTLARAEQAVEGLQGDYTVAAFAFDKLAGRLNERDIVISMLPADWHLKLAELCLQKKAHFVSSSYISDEMRVLHNPARDQGLCLVNEVGLDPGIDHLFAHALMHDYRASKDFSPANQHYFRSYCGGFPKVPNDFRYKFSWSPLGVLKALKSPARSIRDGEILETRHPWDAISDYETTLPHGSESFQAYPNRDSLPFMADYGFAEDWDVQEFVRGTLRLPGWSAAWADIFSEVESLEGESGQKRLVEMSEELWKTQSYQAGEADRVVLAVELEVRDKPSGKTVWHRSFALDAAGDERGSAMARLVSTPVSYAVEAVKQGSIGAGVSAAPSDPGLVKTWLDQLRQDGESFELIDFCQESTGS